MGMINKTNLINITEHFAKTNYVSKPRTRLVDISKLKYKAQQLTCDIFEKSVPNSIESAEVQNIFFADTMINLKKLQELVNQNKTLNEMATELQIPASRIRSYLDKHKIKNPNLEELAILRKYFSATTPKEKAETYAIVDEYIEQIAQDKYQLENTIPYEDYLQDFRLKFLELAEKRKKQSLVGSRNIFKELREIEPLQEPKLNKTDLSLAIDKADDIDFATQHFEDSNFINYLLENSGLKDREYYIVKNCCENGKSFNTLADALLLTPTQVRNIFDKALKKINKTSTYLNSEKYLKQKAGVAWDEVKPVYI